MNEEFFKKLVSAFGPTGREHDVIQLISEQLTGFEVSIDALGNLVALRGKGPYTCFLTHVDQPGWVAEHLDSSGLLHLKPVPAGNKLGEGWSRDSSGNLFRIISTNKGKSFRAEGLSEKGKMGTFLAPSIDFNTTVKYIYGTALSDRTGAAAVVEAASCCQNENVAFCFYTSRHLNFAGLTGAISGLSMNSIYIVDTLSSDSVKGATMDAGSVCLLRTARSIAPPEQIDEILKLATSRKDAGKVQRAMLSEGASAADVLSRKGYASVTIGVLCSWSGSRIEKISIEDYQDLVSLISGLSNKESQDA